MKRSPYERREGKRAPIAVSLAVHVVVILLLGSITFHYEFGTPSRGSAVRPEHLVYVTAEPGPVGRAGGSTGNRRKPPKKTEIPSPLVAPSVIPSTLPPIPPPTVSAGVGTSNGNGSGTGSGVGAATGLEPAVPDSRIGLNPITLRVPLSTAERNDSAVKAIFQVFREAELAAEANQGRSPRDWTFDRNGQKYGLDSQYIYLGRFKLPSAILAALPLNPGGVDGARLIANRNAEWIRNDIYTHAQGMSEEDFKAAIKRIRERKDRERKEAQDDKAKDRVQP
jgi:hypothetical protein